MSVAVDQSVSSILQLPNIRYLTPVLARHIGKPIRQSDPNAQRSWKLQMGEIEFVGPKLLDCRQRMRAGVSCGEKDRALKVGVCVCMCVC